ncbi:EF-P beta-lysylation protein EpmB [Pantoea sp. Nvir]|uniref:EF-P beta-lysylation protein EpmB n=1 Tax=Pantoea sp. Nvir TaxID=2576760 RepID=UPI00135B32D8|nr:EF-P beta-lysylation protein EpmB [Pantoea sp. Nvir]MXP66464.1 EF-P beta-lysylation protein EpmB [Pantoea sp. Nvir]CAJ0993408.1 L-lysine 2,3-aminomutase [Pantoea sp. Nvir]
MTYIVNRKLHSREEWLQQLADVVKEPNELLQLLGLDQYTQLADGINASSLFALRVPRTFIARMKPGDAQDPLLLQVVTQSQEFIQVPGYSTNPLNEQCSVVPGLLHKYRNRALLLVKGSCAVNCRYCFRRYFPYQENQGNKRNWQRAINYILTHPEIDEIIFSGGDPLMAKDHELAWLISAMEQIPHLKTLRIHSRLPVVIPSRITDRLCDILAETRLQVLVVTHINHAQEFDDSLIMAMRQLKSTGVILLNQSVLLRGVNNSTLVLSELSKALFNTGILPYYLHVLDKVQGAGHFFVPDEEARALVRELLHQVAGYMVPKLVRDSAGELGKTPLDLQLPFNSLCSDRSFNKLYKSVY